jgi:hypothetical protein
VRAAPACGGWSRWRSTRTRDLTRHVAEVYLHKAECIRLTAFPEEWPPGVLDPDPVTSLDRTYAVLTGQFSAHSTTDPAATWYEPDQTVAFWIRRMAQETVIHRIDAELAAGRPVSPVPDDLAVDGIDEVLKLFVGYGSTLWLDDFGPLLDAPDQRPVSVSTSHRTWTVAAAAGGDGEPAQVHVEAEAVPRPANRRDTMTVFRAGSTPHPPVRLLLVRPLACGLTRHYISCRCIS